MSKRRTPTVKRNVEIDRPKRKTVRDDEALARNFFLASLAGIAVGAIGGGFSYGSPGATVGAVFGAALGVGALFGYLSLRR